MSNLDISSVFQPESLSVLSFLREPGCCFYIPVYQRPYSWDDEKVERLVNDVVHGLNKIISHEEALTFIGTIICIHDNQYTSIRPIFRQQVPSKVMTVIDGQQRLTSVILLNTILHDELRKRIGKFENKEEEHFQWIYDQCSETLGEIEDTIYENQKKGDALFRHYPKVIRSIEDKWSTRKGEAGYNSPIGRYLFEYISHIIADETKAFKFLPKDKNGVNDSKYNVIIDNRKTMIRQIKKIYNGEDSDFPEIMEVLDNKTLSENVLGHETPEDVKKYISEGADQKDKVFNAYIETVRILLFAKYLNRNVAITTVTTTKEDYAFDMFEALNTTGEPLSAFETFKPQIVLLEGEADYETSPSHEYVQNIDSYLSNFTKADKRQDATTNLLIPFALAEDGEKIGKKMTDQRVYLRRSFTPISEDINKGRDYIKNMSHVSVFLESCWPEGNQTPPSIPGFSDIEDQPALVCLDFLKQMKHSIVTAPLVCFLSKLLNAKDDELKQEALKDFLDAIKAVTAFSVIWRAKERGTRSIDGKYRELMEKGLNDLSIQPFARQKGAVGYTAVTLKGLKRALNHFLQKEGISNLEQWKHVIATQPVYQFSKPLTRFLLVLASNLSDPKENGKLELKRGRAGNRDFLNIKDWKSSDLATVEHIAPQSKADTWSDDLFEEPETIHTLGNLTLLPSGENNIASDFSWEKKNLIFKIFASKTDDNFESAIKDAELKGINFSRKKQDILSSSKFLPMTTALANYDASWSISEVQTRSENIAELSWEYLSEWLKVDET